MPPRHGGTANPDKRGTGPLAGIELPDALTEDFFIGGLKTAGALARVNLTVTDGANEFSWV